MSSRTLDDCSVGMGSRMQATATPRSGESKVREEERRHNERKDCLLNVYANLVIMLGNNDLSHHSWRQESYYREKVHNLKTTRYKSQTSQRWQRKEERDVVWNDT